MRQMEISDTAVFERPQVGRAWFEAAIRDHLTLGRPDKVRIVVGRQVRSTTPGRFETNVITRGVYPHIEIRYKSSGAKAYFKHEQALRVETTLNNAEDLRLKKTLNAENWRALRQPGPRSTSASSTPSVREHRGCPTLPRSKRRHADRP